MLQATHFWAAVSVVILDLAVLLYSVVSMYMFSLLTELIQVSQLKQGLADRTAKTAVSVAI